MSSNLLEENVGSISDKNVSFRWVIHDFYAKVRNKGDSIKSPIFLNAWTLKLYPKGKAKDDAENYVSIAIINESHNSVTASVTMSLITKRNEEKHEFTFQSNIFHGKEGKNLRRNFRWFERSFIMNESNNVIVDGALIIQCYIADMQENTNYSSLPQNEVMQMEQPIISPDSLECLKDYEKLLGNEELSDVTFCVQETKIHAHKTILMARSSVFKDMLKNETAEGYSRVIDIEGMKSGVFQELLGYLYVGKVNDIEIIAKDLLIAADKFALDSLKLKCEKVMLNNVSVENSSEYLRVAHAYNVTNLKQEMINFITANSEQIVVKDEFYAFCQMHPNLLYEITRKLSSAACASKKHKFGH